jgi:DNA-binding NtrC family response regulator
MDRSRVPAGSNPRSRSAEKSYTFRNVSDDARTVPHLVKSVPVRSLRAEVIEGPDRGAGRIADADAITIGTAPNNDLVIKDETVSRYHLELRRIDGRIVVQDHGSTNGTKLGVVALERATIPPGTVLELGKTAIKVDDGETIDCEVLANDRLGRIIGRTADMRRLLAVVSRAARTEASALILGETGTGKEVLAYAIHDASSRAGKAFETVDCGSLLPTLVASELFGHEKGAFTGAENKHIGAFERADGGTLFLDEIGELPLQLQATLLGALERKSFRRVGGTKPITIDVRVLAATNRDLRAEVNKGGFREDLYYRLAVLLLRIPPLRERTDDIPLLVEHFLRDTGHAGRVDDVIPKAVMDSLKHHRWPGNVRELRNFVEAALAMGEAPAIDGADRPSQDSFDGPNNGEMSVRLTMQNFDNKKYRDARDVVLREFEHVYFTALLEKTRGNVAMAAREADMDRTYLAQLLRKLGLREGKA